MGIFSAIAGLGRQRSARQEVERIFNAMLPRGREPHDLYNEASDLEVELLQNVPYLQGELGKTGHRMDVEALRVALAECSYPHRLSWAWGGMMPTVSLHWAADAVAKEVKPTIRGRFLQMRMNPKYRGLSDAKIVSIVEAQLIEEQESAGVGRARGEQYARAVGVVKAMQEFRLERLRQAAA